MPLGFVNGGSGNSPEELFRSIPPVSKVLILGMVGTMFSIVLGVCSPYEYALSWPLVWNKFHLWRLFTSGIFPGKPGYGALMSIFSIGMFSIRWSGHQEKSFFGAGMRGDGFPLDISLSAVFLRAWSHAASKSVRPLFVRVRPESVSSPNTYTSLLMLRLSTACFAGKG
ncbi:unnamed protein product [Ectocarpus sp. CCAP 1310/34]|nr:unnamed protein product [Ectocarpus sp. CCAP 1310/34]